MCLGAFNSLYLSSLICQEECIALDRKESLSFIFDMGHNKAGHPSPASGHSSLVTAVFQIITFRLLWCPRGDFTARQLQNYQEYRSQKSPFSESIVMCSCFMGEKQLIAQGYIASCSWLL